MPQLANQSLQAVVGDDGSLHSIDNRLAAETYRFTADVFAVETDRGVFSNAAAAPAFVRHGQNGPSFWFQFDDLDVELVYDLAGENSFFRRTLRLHNRTPLRLLGVKLGQTRFAAPAAEAIHYLTFWMAPTVEFIRHAEGGLFTGIENPFYRADLDVQGVELGYEPGLILRAGEGYTSEAQFIGVYKKSGVMVEDSARPFRYPNGSGHIPIDRSESRAMRAFALDYLQPSQQTLLAINYQFFHPLPQMPATDADAWYYRKTIDAFAAIGGDMIIFKPLHRHRKPDAATPWWNVLPDEEHTVARQIADYARARGLTYGFYLGIAGGHGEEGNAAGLPFRPEEIGWKKLDAAGRRAPDNCIGCDDFFAWWLLVHDNTIKRYGLSNWSWDPSLGSAMNCYDESHGHLAGQGAYKGWRRCMELVRRLKQENPGLFIQGFYGTKHFGLWGLRGTDQHEVYNEQTAIVCTHHTQISDDRQNADGLRFQNYWSMRFRFLPTMLGHALVHRMSEGEFDRELIKAWDFYGWRYGLLAALAVSGSLMPAILPVDVDLVPGYQEFYEKWSSWAKAHFDYVPYTDPFGEQVQPGCVDGYARIKGDHGFLFLFNGNPRSAAITFEVGDEINLQEPGSYELVELHPQEGRRILDDCGKAVFVRGAAATLTLPPNECLVLELRRAVLADEPLLAGLAGQVSLDGGVLSISEVRGLPGHTCRVQVQLPTSRRVDSVAVNGAAQAYTHRWGEVTLDVHFAGERFPRELDNWTTPEGAAFDFPYHGAHALLRIQTTFHLPSQAAVLLENARPANHAEMDDRIAAWQESSEASYSYHNFVGCRPHRLWLVIPFTMQKADAATYVTGFPPDLVVEAVLNGVDLAARLRRDINGNSCFADITDLVRYGQGALSANTLELRLQNLGWQEFMGPFLLYPPEAPTPVVAAASPARRQPVVYTRSLLDPGPPRYAWGGSAPRVTEASVTGNVTLTQPVQLRVRVDRPPAALQQVLYTHSGFPWMGKLALVYDAALACWVAEIRPGERAAIQENEYIYVWAIGSDGLYSDYYPVKVGWDFSV